jgi:hypothetical protein
MSPSFLKVIFIGYKQFFPLSVLIFVVVTFFFSFPASDEKSTIIRGLVFPTPSLVSFHIGYECLNMDFFGFIPLQVL